MALRDCASNDLLNLGWRLGLSSYQRLRQVASWVESGTGVHILHLLVSNHACFVLPVGSLGHALL